MTIAGRSSRVLLTLLQLAVTAAAFWILVRLYGLAQLQSVAAQVDPLWIVLAVLAGAVQLAQMAWRWQLLSDWISGTRARFLTLLLGSSRSQLYGLLLPSTLGTDASRIAMLAPESGLGAAARSVVCDRLLGLFALVVIVAATLPLFAMRISAGPAFAGLAMASLGGLACFALLIARPALFRRLPIVGAVAESTASDLRRSIALGGTGGLILSHALLTQLLAVAVFAALAHSVGASIPLLDVLLISLPAMLVATLPISLNGWGVREAAVATAFAYIGADPAQGTATSILFGVVYPLCALVIEFAALPLRRRTAHGNKQDTG